MSLREKVSQTVEVAKMRLYGNRIVDKAIFTYNMGFNSAYREEWLKNHVSRDVGSRALTVEQGVKILEQAQNPQTSRHFGEAFAIPAVSYAVAGLSSAYILAYAWETNDPLAWGYTLSHFAQGVPKLSISSLTRAGLLATSIAYDHVQDKQIGSWKRVAGEAAAIGISAISWVGAGNAGPAARIGLNAPDLGPYLSRKAVKRSGRSRQETSTEVDKFMIDYGYTSLPRIS